jgi:predicted NUDIX family NTP pyrophosphohydrolase
MKTHSAGLLVYRLMNGKPEVFLVHNGGPYWAKKDEGVWSLPKGEVEEGEDPLQTAKREFHEETGFSVPKGTYFELGEIEYPRSHKVVTAWAVEGDFDASKLKSNSFEMEWPPKSGKKQSFPEIDRGDWFSLAEASIKFFPANLPFLERLAKILNRPFGVQEPPQQKSLF